MLSIFLNIGAGEKLMGIRQFGEFSGEEQDYVVFNTDVEYVQVSRILKDSGLSDQEIRDLFGRKSLKDIIASLPEGHKQTVKDAEKKLNRLEDRTNFEYGSATHILLQDATVEIIFSLSPFNYKPLNPETHRVLKTDGIVVVGGNKSNKFWKNPFEENCQALFEKLDFFPVQVRNILDKIGSQTTHGQAVKNIDYTAYIKRV